MELHIIMCNQQNNVSTVSGGSYRTSDLPQEFIWWTELAVSSMFFFVEDDYDSETL